MPKFEDINSVSDIVSNPLFKSHQRLSSVVGDTIDGCRKFNYMDNVPNIDSPIPSAIRCIEDFDGAAVWVTDSTLQFDLEQVDELLSEDPNNQAYFIPTHDYDSAIVVVTSDPDALADDLYSDTPATLNRMTPDELAVYEVHEA